MENNNCPGCHENHSYFKKILVYGMIAIAAALVGCIGKFSNDMVNGATAKAIREQEVVISNMCQSLSGLQKQVDLLALFALINWEEYYAFVVREHMKTPESVQGTPEEHAEVLRQMLLPGQREEFIKKQIEDYQ